MKNKLAIVGKQSPVRWGIIVTWGSYIVARILDYIWLFDCLPLEERSDYYASV